MSGPPLNPRTSSAVEILVDMQMHGQSVTLNWGEDNGVWECSWITGGNRYSGFSKNPYFAILAAYMNALNTVAPNV